MSRARWLALGSTVALVGCNGAVASSAGDAGGSVERDAASVTPDDGSAVHEAGWEAGIANEAGWSGDSGTLPDDASVEASSDAEVVAEGGVVCSSRSGTFACQGQTCDRSTQLCDQTGGGCQPYDGVIAQQQPEAGSCGACPSCACLQPTLWGSCTCQEDDAGSIAISCGGCYGAPPARLERIA